MSTNPAPTSRSKPAAPTVTFVLLKSPLSAGGGGNVAGVDRNPDGFWGRAFSAGFGAGERGESSSRERDDEDFFGNSNPRSRNEGRGSRGIEDGSRDDRDVLGDNLIVGFDLSEAAIGFCSDGRVTDGFAAIGFCGDG